MDHWPGFEQNLSGVDHDPKRERRRRVGYGGLSVLVFTPSGPRLEPETVQAILALKHPAPVSRLFQADNPYRDDDGGRRNILHQYQQGRAAFLAGGYDAMLVIEADIIPPPDALNRLLALEADLAYGVYRFRHTDRINLVERDEPERYLELAALHDGPVEVGGSGLGCTLIRRHVLELIGFRWGGGRAYADHYFTTDAREAGFSMRADTRVVCGHKDERGNVLWPKS